MTIDNGQLTIIGGGGPPAAPWLSLWESWLGAAETERAAGPFVIAETIGAEGIIPSLTVGNGLCAVPLRCNYNPCG